MRPLPFLTRAALLIFSVAAVACLAGIMLGGTWGGRALALLILLLGSLAAAAILRAGVARQHGYFVKVLKDFQKTLQTGQTGFLLKSERAADSFADVAEHLNAVAVSTSEQVTQLLNANRQLDQNRTLFLTILSTMVEGVLVLDGERRVLFVNRAARLLFDNSQQEVEQRPVWEVIRSPELSEVIESMPDNPEDFRREIELKRQKAVVEVTAAPLPLKPKAGVVLVLHDVTELRRLERLRREFVSNVSHELKTPLTSIQAYADTLLNGAAQEPEHCERFITRIIEQSERLQNLIQDMLRLARIESQADAFPLKPIPVVAVLQTCVDARQAVAAARNIELTLELPQPSPVVNADLEGLRTIVDNLVTNALNYARAHVQVRCLTSASDVVIEVEDDGIGIPLEHQERIFERFYRVDKARSRGMGGTGLGLAIVKHVVSVFDGSVEVESQVERGSQFRVRLPVCTQPVESS